MAIRKPVRAGDEIGRFPFGKVWRRDDGKIVTLTMTSPVHWTDGSEIDFAPFERGDVLAVPAPVGITIDHEGVGYGYGGFTAKLAGSTGAPTFYRVPNSTKAGFFWENALPDVDVRILLLPDMAGDRVTVTCNPHVIVKTPAAAHSFGWLVSGTANIVPPVLESALGETYPEFVMMRRAGDTITIAIDTEGADFQRPDYPIVIH